LPALAAHQQHRPPRFRLAVSAGVAATLTLPRRGTGDDLAASLELAAPRTSGHAALGRNWLIDGADAAAQAQLLADASVHGQIQALLRARVSTIAWSEASQAVFVSGVIQRDAAGDAAILNLAVALALASSASRPPAPGKRWVGLAGFDADPPGSAVMGLVALGLILFALGTLPVIGLDAAYTPVSRGPP
jgi:hypothetical protein